MKVREWLVLVWALGALSVSAGCAEAGRDQPVTTVTEGGVSNAPPAAEAEKRKVALVRFVHAVPGLAGVDFLAGDDILQRGAVYKNVTAYAEVSASGGRDFRVRLAGQEGAEFLAEDDEGVKAGEHYTAVALPVAASAVFSKGEAERAELRFVADDLSPPPAGKAKVRVINASPDLGGIDVYAAGRAEPLLKGVEFAGGSKYQEVEPSGGAVEVRREGENVATLAVPNLKIEAGKLYTILVVGRTKGAAKPEAVIFEDTVGGAARR